MIGASRLAPRFNPSMKGKTKELPNPQLIDRKGEEKEREIRIKFVKILSKITCAAVCQQIPYRERSYFLA